MLWQFHHLNVIASITASKLAGFGNGLRLRNSPARFRQALITIGRGDLAESAAPKPSLGLSSFGQEHRQAIRWD